MLFMGIRYFRTARGQRSITHTSVWSGDSQGPSVGHLQEELRAACQTLPVTRRHGPAPCYCTVQTSHVSKPTVLLVCDGLDVGIWAAVLDFTQISWVKNKAMPFSIRPGSLGALLAALRSDRNTKLKQGAEKIKSLPPDGNTYQFPALFDPFLNFCLQYCSQMSPLFVLAPEPFLFEKQAGKQQGLYRYSPV